MNFHAEGFGQAEAPRVSLFAMFIAFFRVGMTAFGGPAMLPHVRKLVVSKHAWITEEDFRLGLSLCQMLPGATVVQIAAYTGLRLHGLIGALAAFVGFAAPSFLLVTLLSILYFRHQDISWLLTFFAGLQALVVAIIASAALDFLRRYTKSWQDALIALGAACGILLRVHPVLIIASAMLAGLFLYRKRIANTDPTHETRIRGFRDSIVLLGSMLLVVVVLRLVAPELYALATCMIRVDLVAFGGGLAALPTMLYEVVHVSGWMTEKTFLDGIAIGQVTPGPIVLSAAFVGYAVHGLIGAVAAAWGIFAPSILFLVCAVPYCDRLLTSVRFQRAMQASLATLGGLMAAITVTLAQPITWNPFRIMLCLAALVALWRKIDVLWVVLGGIVLSLIFS